MLLANRNPNRRSRWPPPAGLPLLHHAEGHNPRATWRRPSWKRSTPSRSPRWTPMRRATPGRIRMSTWWSSGPSLSGRDRDPHTETVRGVPAGPTHNLHRSRARWPNSLASVTSDRYVSIKGLGISRSTEGSWNFRGPFVFPRLGPSRKLGQSPDLGSDDLEGAVGLVRTQVRQRDGPRRQVRQLQADRVRRLRHEHRLEIEQAESRGSARAEWPPQQPWVLAEEGRRPISCNRVLAVRS